MTAPTVLDSAFFAEFLNDYFAECDEHLLIVRQRLLVLEGLVNAPALDHTLLDDLFRSFHTLKGLSAMVGVKDAEQLAHQMEDTLRAVHQDKLALSAAVLAALNAGAVVLAQVIAARRDERSGPDIRPISQRLFSLGSDGTPPARPVPPTPVYDAPSAAVPSPALPSPSLPSPSLPSPSLPLLPGQAAWRFHFVPSPELAGRGITVNQVRARLQQVGALIHAAPQIGSDGAIAFEFVVAGSPSPALVAAWQEDGLYGEPVDWTNPPPGLTAPFTADQQPAAAASSSDPAASVESASAAALLSPAGPAVTPRTNHTPAASASHPAFDTAATMLAPTNVVRVDLGRLDDLMRMMGDLVISRARLEDSLTSLQAQAPALGMRNLQEINLALERQLRVLREGLMRVRMVPVGEVFTRMQFVIHDLARDSDKKVRLTLQGQETEIDKYVVERLIDPLLHLVRNAFSHGLESADERVAAGKPAEGHLLLSAAAAGDAVIIEVADDGRGVDIESVAVRARAHGLLGRDAELDANSLLDVLCAPGFSTRDEADLASGRGMGMSVVRDTVQGLGGSLTLETQPGQGTRFVIELPLTLAIVDALIVRVREQRFAVPLPVVREVLQLTAAAITRFEHNEIMAYRNAVLPLLRLADFFNLNGAAAAPSGAGHEQQVIVVGSDSNLLGVVVDRIQGKREIVVRAVTDPLVQVQGVAGATELGDGRVVLILDTGSLLRAARMR
ncbi:MAG: chemotaxis protein CheA [Anaerolineae bacterium]